jgi:hypothetical protein
METEMFNRFGSDPVRGKMILMNTDAEKEWQELTSSQREFIMSHLASIADKMETKIAIETLCNVINELTKRIEFLENKSFEEE